jgi:citrate lyase subunit alpha/citrate CoA-transferase
LVDYVVAVDVIGDAGKIATGATRMTQNPKELLMAEYAARVINNSGYMKDGFSFQAGSGGASLAVIKFLKEYMKGKGIKGGAISGGITSVLVELLEEGYFYALLDAQTFDAGASDSFNRNINHIEMSASMYANPYNKGCVANMLDIMVLSATEVDVDFNVNVLTGSDGVIMGAQGGHPDTADGAKLRIVTAPLIRKNIPIIRDDVTTVVTPGCNIDIVVTDKGIAINPLRPDLKEKLSDKGLPLLDINELKEEAEAEAGKPVPPIFGEEIVGIVEARDGSVMDVIRRVKI